MGLPLRSLRLESSEAKVLAETRSTQQGLHKRQTTDLNMKEHVRVNVFEDVA